MIKIHQRKNFVRCDNCGNGISIEEELANEYERGARTQAEMDAKTANEYKQKLREQVEKLFDGESAYCEEDEKFFDAIKAGILKII